MMSTIKTEHPHIVHVGGVAGGRPVIQGTRITVEFIARLLQGGVVPAEIIETYPDLSSAAVYDAISYYFDHQVEVDKAIAEAHPDAVTQQLGAHVRPNGKVVFSPR